MVLVDTLASVGATNALAEKCLGRTNGSSLRANTRNKSNETDREAARISERRPINTFCDRQKRRMRRCRSGIETW